jgi:RND family efflux transporter MFP subunit
VALLILQLSQRDAPPAPAAAPDTRPSVQVISVSPGRYQATISAYGSASARHQLELTSQVAGQIKTLHPDFATGRVVAAGTVLAELEDSSYRAALSSAERTLADARVALLEEEREGLQAQREWQDAAMGAEPDSELVLRTPQARAARAAVAEAAAAVASARYNLGQTRIRAPFAALISRRDISPGSYVSSGGAIAQLLASDQLEIALPLAARDWQQLPDLNAAPAAQSPATSSPATLLPAPLPPVTLTQVETGQQWQGQLRRAEQHLDASTRQRSAIVSVDNPLDLQPPLFPGTFVQATLRGRYLDNLWQLPASALSQRGEIWYVDSSATLRTFAARSQFSSNGYVYIPVPAALAASPQQVVVHPLSSYLAGQTVTAVAAAMVTDTATETGNE